MNLSNDILIYMVEFLSPIEVLLILRKTSKKMRKILKIEKELKRIKNDINISSDNKITNWKNIYNTNSFIAGSALTHALHLEKTWKPTDIDVWTLSINNFDEKYKRIEGEGSSALSDIQVYVYNIIDTNININEVSYSYETSKEKHMNMNKYVYYNKIIESFDYDFLKAIFNGKELIIYNPENILYKKSKCCSSFQKKYHRHGELSKKGFRNHHAKRNKKYTDRGYILSSCKCFS